MYIKQVSDFPYPCAIRNPSDITTFPGEKMNRTYSPEILDDSKGNDKYHILLLQVIIHGFKSYREQTVVDPFDPGHNVVGKFS